jgi:hypothetical protein
MGEKNLMQIYSWDQATGEVTPTDQQMSLDDLMLKSIGEQFGFSLEEARAMVGDMDASEEEE